MSVTKHGMIHKHDKGTMREPTLLAQQLIRGGLVLLMVVMFLMGSFAVAAPSTLRITIGTFAPYYSPTLVHIGTGTPISWENPTADLHSITHDGCKTGERCAFDSGPLGPNGTFTVPHLPPSSYSYHCSFHPIMRGVLVVVKSGSSGKT
jgi:plastocyanin